MQTWLWETCLSGDECRALEASNSCDAPDTSRVLDSPDDAVDECSEPKGTSRGGVKRKSPNHGPVSRDVLEVVRAHVCVCDSVLDPLALLMTFTLYFAHPMLCSPCLVISDMVLRKQRLSLP